MKLTALRLFNVRRFADRGVAIEDIGDGVNVLCAANEQGKSTCFDALHALFFQPHSRTTGAVRSLRPYSGGSPLIEVEVEVGGEHLRLTKQFYGGGRALVTDLRSGRVLAQADEAERRIADLVQDDATGPAGLLWVRQGNTGLQKRSKSEEEDEKQARETALSSVQGEVEAVTGGRRMIEALQACEEELARYLTATDRVRAGGALALAIKRRDELLQTERKLEGDVQALREALDARRRCSSRLAELTLPEAAAARRERAADADAALRVGRANAEALAFAERRVALEQQRRQVAAVALEDYRASGLRALELRGHRGSALERSQEAEARDQAAIAAVAAADAEVEAAETAERQARDLLARHEQALRSLEAAGRLARERAILADALAARKDLEECEAAQRTLAVPAKALQDLETLEATIAAGRAAQAARSPTLRIDYHEAAAGRVSLDGQPLPGGEERALERTTLLRIEGIGSITIRQRHRDDDADDSAKAESRRGALLERLGVATLAAARERALAAAEKAGQAKLAKQRLALQAPDGVEALRDAIATLERQVVPDAELPGDPRQARLAMEQARQRVEAARNAARAGRPGLEQARQARLQTAADLAAIDRELARVELALGPLAERATRDSALAVELARTAAACDEAAAETARLRADAPDLAGLEAAAQRAASVLRAAESEAATLREEVAKLSGGIAMRAEDSVEEAWEEAKAAREAAAEEVTRIEHEVALLTRLREVLRNAQRAARDLFFEPVMTELRPLLGLLFSDAAIAFDEDTLLPRSVTRDGLEEDIEVLSGGMREQLAVLTRLAFARLLARGGRPTPVILDDALAYSDDDRIERMFDVLHRQARDQQIIVFSCRQRAFAQLGGNSLHMTAWSPAGR